MRSERPDHGLTVRPIACMLMIGLGALCGCASRHMAESSAVDQFPGADQDIEFMEKVESMNAVTNNDMLHGLLLVSSGVDPARDYEERVLLARQKGWVPKDWDKPANESAASGDLAMAGCRLGGIEGGLTMKVFGPSGRYCLRELESRGIMPTRTDYQSISGPEFRDFLNRLDQNLLSQRPRFADPTKQEDGPDPTMPLPPTPARGG
ncbi:MAG: hypothetical protein FJ254_07665 [Phycisphaerae bacterium]|nr:hypothetical protein [Phycisphaerae bacterium]